MGGILQKLAKKLTFLMACIYPTMDKTVFVLSVQYLAIGAAINDQCF